MEGLRPSRALQPSRRTRTCHVERGAIRPHRGAERGLEANDRRFRTAKARGRTGTDLGFDMGTDGQATMTICHPRARLRSDAGWTTITIMVAGCPRRR